MFTLAALDTQDVVVMATVFGGILALVQIGDRLWRPRTRPAGAEERPAQSQACHFEHVRLVEGSHALETALQRMADAQAELMLAVKTEHEITKLRHAELMRALRQPRLEDEA